MDGQGKSTVIISKLRYNKVQPDILNLRRGCMKRIFAGPPRVYRVRYMALEVYGYRNIAISNRHRLNTQSDTALLRNFEMKCRARWTDPRAATGEASQSIWAIGLIWCVTQQLLVESDGCNERQGNPHVRYPSVTYSKQYIYVGVSAYMPAVCYMLCFWLSFRNLHYFYYFCSNWIKVTRWEFKK
jgi:hypothetical protein